jgi:uncharacterized protein YcnI
MKALAVLTLALAAVALPATAAAHVQISPTVAAPADATLFTLLVPNESDNPTIQVDLKIPDGTIPFSFEDVPGWTRSEQRKANGALDVVTWKGSLPAAAFVRFSFLARTPDEPGDVAWPAVQRYADGTVVRWIGPPDSEQPAAVTTISADAPRQNAGGEGESNEPASTGTEPPAESPPATAEPPATVEPAGTVEPGGAETSAAGAEADGSDDLALGVALGGLVVALLALGLGVWRRRRTG